MVLILLEPKPYCINHETTNNTKQPNINTNGHFLIGDFNSKRCLTIIEYQWHQTFNLLNLFMLCFTTSDAHITILLFSLNIRLP